MFDLLARRSIRKYQLGVEICDDVINQIISDCQQAPSARNRQPIEFVIVKSLGAMQLVRPLFPEVFPQVDTASIIIFLLGNSQTYEKDSASDLSPGEYDRIILDGGIMVNQVLQVVRLYGYEACALGHFKKELLVETLGYPANYLPILAISVGLPDDSGRPYNRKQVNDIAKIL